MARRWEMGICLGVSLLFSRPSHADPRAEYVNADEVAKEGVSHLLDVATLGDATLVTERRRRIRDVVTFDLSSRVFLGHRLAWCLGLDGRAGASDAGAAWGATGYLVGLGVRWGAGNVVSLCAGGGIDRTGDALRTSATLPAELRGSFSLGPMRPTLWLRPSWVGREARRRGATPSFVDELEAGLLVRLARQHRYWSDVSAGGGLSLGVTYREFLGAHAVGLLLGFDFAGER